MTRLREKKCVPCEGGTPPLTKDHAKKLLSELDQWQLNETATEIQRLFTFKNFFRTMAFVNAIAWIANNENHHPDMKVGYNYCNVHFKTHAINGLSENDFICASKIDALIS